METAKHLFEIFFKDVTNPLVRHHLDSFSDFLENKLPTFIKASNPLELLFDDGRKINIYIGGKNGTLLKYKIPTTEDGLALLPHLCRLENKTYQFDLIGDIEVEYVFSDEIKTKKFEDITLAQIPLMLKSSLCYLRSMTSEQLYDSGECNFELGGYFIIDGQERVLLTQESLGINMFHAKKRRVLKLVDPTRTIIEKDSESKLDDISSSEDYEYVSGINSASEDGTRGPYSHIVTLGPKTTSPIDPQDISKQNDWSVFLTKRLITTKLPGFLQPVPLLSVMNALGVTTDKELYDIILHDIPEKQRSMYDTLFLSLILSHEKLLEKEKSDDIHEDINLFILRRQTRTRSHASVYTNLYSKLFPHCEIQENESSSSFYKRKAFLLGHMIRMVMDIDLDIKENTDRDHFRFKRLDSSGELCFQEFRRIYNDVLKNMKQTLDSRVEFEKEVYKGKKLIELVQEDTLRSKYWKTLEFITRYTKSFKGKWGDQDGVCQVLTRFSYVGTIAHLRRVNLMMDKDTKNLSARRLHSSSWGFMCPSDNPDGGNVGMIKSMTLFSKVSKQIKTSEIKSLIFKNKKFIKLNLINFSEWNILWTKIYLNSDLLGIITDTETFHQDLLEKRHNGIIDNLVSLYWNRLDNIYYIFCDSGRICRPVYRQGITSKKVESSKNWKSILNLIDYIDPQESECLKISLEPFHPIQQSEIHGSVLFSSSASINPNTDHNQAPRNMFSCQQVKQACSWYNTAFNKRFDTISTWLHSPQRPLSQTWTTPYILGGNACMPYGENAIVAVAIYTGYNQDDSILLNETSIKRGMFQTSYYHSYDFQEELLNDNNTDLLTNSLKIKTEFCNVATNSKYRETVIRKKDKDYSLLDNDGLIKIGSLVNVDTILVGMITPVFDSVTGIVNSFRDISILPKKGQHGIIDSIYRYTTNKGTQGVKIRIVELRLPVLGDKFSARHGQKGTCGALIKEEDMPFTASGLKPDMVVNPHAFPSRMTIGQFIECMSNKVGINLGCLIDGTAFSTQNRILDTKEILIKLGYHPYGNELMYNGMNGEMMESEIFIGPTYYLRSKLMTEDKINYRDTGPVTSLTKQPLEGRAQDGGLRIGEMERDSILSHGISNFLTESLMKRSDGRELLYQPETGLMDSNDNYVSSKIEMPYSMRLFIQEIESMHLKVGLFGI